MSHVFTLKLPHPLLHRLEEVSRQEGKSKGAYLREALQIVLAQKSSPLDRVRQITENLLKKKKTKATVDWDELKKKIGAASLSPEEEVLRSRRRRM